MHFLGFKLIAVNKLSFLFQQMWAYAGAGTKEKFGEAKYIQRERARFSCYRCVVC